MDKGKGTKQPIVHKTQHTNIQINLKNIVNVKQNDYACCRKTNTK